MRTTFALSLGLMLLAGCDGEQGMSYPELPEVDWEPFAMEAPPSLTDMLREGSEPTLGPSLGDPQAVWAELGVLIVVQTDGRISMLHEEDGVVALEELGSLPVTCLPWDIAVDGRGGVCALVPCGHAAMCSNDGTWSENASLRETDVGGLSSAPGAIVAWRGIGEGRLRNVERTSVVGSGFPAWEIIASHDGGAQWGLLTRLNSPAPMRGVEVSAPGRGYCVIEEGGRLQTHHDCLGEGGRFSFTNIGPLETTWTRLIMANGALLAASLRADHVILHPVFPEGQVGVTHSIPITGSVGPIAAWSPSEIVISSGSSLHVADLSLGQYQTFAGRVRLPAGEPAANEPAVVVDASDDSTADASVDGLRTDVIGLGRVGTRLVAVLADGAVVVF